MQRRQFLSAGLAASAVIASGALAQVPAGREFYLLRRYTLRSGPGQKLTQQYFEHALLPALNRLGIANVGVFNLTYGETPTMFVLMPGRDLNTLATVDLLLAKDAAFFQAAEPFWGAPQKGSAFERVDSTLFAAFEGYPQLTVPKHEKRIFQMRTYESPSEKDHVLKVKMFHSGEFGFFAKAGAGQVFYGDALIGERLPQLTYMLTFPDMAALDAAWTKFGADPDWKKLSADPQYASEAIVSNVNNLILTPTTYSQI